MTSTDDVLDLFEAFPKSADVQVDAQVVLGPYGIRARVAELSAAFLNQGNALTPGPSKVRLNLFSSADDDATFVASGRVESFTPFQFEPVALLDAPVSQDGVLVFSGRLDNESDSAVTITLVNGVIDLDLFVPSIGSLAHFQAMRFDTTTRYVIRQLDGELLPDCGVEDEDEETEVDVADDGAGDRSDIANPVAKLLIVYTSRVKAALGGEASVRARAVSAVNKGNDVLENSNVDVRLGLAAVVELPDYSEISGKKGYYTMLEQLVKGSVIGLEKLHALRDQYEADLVSLLVANGSLGGLANVMSKPSASFANRAYSVVNYDSASIWTLVHEIGHNFGCCHETGCKYTPSYSKGHTFKADGSTWNTVMVKQSVPGTRIGYFSNPLVSFRGVSTGTEARNNARVIKESTSTVIAFRPLQNLA
ncbi:M12 family metallo-peptidase [Massilia niabensis]|uniref:M12 family metallo-peptidase n=1 Tax=Massilia niabensis TaxID=544910 RepID=A0ABW0L990_9BURK